MVYHYVAFTRYVNGLNNCLGLWFKEMVKTFLVFTGGENYFYRRFSLRTGGVSLLVFNE
jgi:hypothetical protein